MDNNKPYDLRERLLLFAKRILEICKRLPNNSECYRIRGQLAVDLCSPSLFGFLFFWIYFEF